MSAHVQMAADPFELFPPSAEGILRLLETTPETGARKPTPGVEDGEVPAVAPTAGAIRKALEDGGEFGSSAWVSCRAGVVQNYVVRARSESLG